jgi:hypothetical protein
VFKTSTRKAGRTVGVLALAAALPLSTAAIAPAAAGASNGSHMKGSNAWADALNGFSNAPIPPRGFDPRTASARELAYYGFPARPNAHGAQPAWWVERVTQLASATRVALKFQTAPAALQSLAGSLGSHLGTPSGGARGPHSITPYETCTSSDWAGVVDASKNDPTCAEAVQDTYHGVDYAGGDLMIPGLGAQGAGTIALTSAWVGIGTGNSSSPGDPLIQTGVASWWKSLDGARYNFFAEVYPGTDITDIDLPGPGPAAGDDVTMSVNVSHTDGAYPYEAYMDLEYKVHKKSYLGSAEFGLGSGYQGSSSTAEWIVEKPSVSHLPLSNFGVIPFWNGGFDVNGNKEGTAGDGKQAVALDMCQGITEVAKTAFPSSGPYDFEVIQEHTTGSPC